MSARESIFKKVREATLGLSGRSPIPELERIFELRSRLVPHTQDLDTLVTAFSERWLEAHGKLFEGWTELNEFLQERGVERGYADPAALQLLGVEDAGLDREFRRSEVDRYGVGITVASLGIAETGTISLTDRGTSNRLAALAPWIHVAVLKRSDIVPSLFDALQRLGADPSIIYVTGPSKTADIEGILIEGVHGPGIQCCVLV